MEKKEFIKWMETSSFSNEGGDYYRELVDYGDNIYNEVYVKNDSVVFIYENEDSTERIEMTFDEFVDRYNRDTLNY